MWNLRSTIRVLALCILFLFSLPEQGVRAMEDEALRADVEELLVLARKNAAEIKPSDARVFLLSNIAEVYHSMGMKDKAAEVLHDATKAAEEMEGYFRLRGYKHHRLAEVMAGFIEIGDDATAFEILESLPDSERYAGLREISNMQLKIGLLEKALETAEKIEELPYKGECMQLVAIEYAKQGNTKRALDLAEQNPNLSSRANALVGIASELLQSGNRVDGEKILRDAEKLIEEIPFDKDEPNDIKPFSMSNFAVVLASYGDKANAERIANAIPREPWQDIAWERIATESARLDDWGYAIDTVQKISSPFYRSQAYGSLVEVFLEKGQTESAEIYTDAITDDFCQGSALIKVAKAYALDGQEKTANAIFERVLRDAKKVVEDRERPVGNVYGSLMYQLVQAQAELGNVRLAKEWAEKIEAPKDRGAAYAAIARGLLKN
jgi:tetratricopeptide (TPR) repeat protein